MSGQLCGEVGEPSVVDPSSGREGERGVLRRADIGGEDLHAGKVVVDQFAHSGDAVGGVQASIDDVGGIVGVGVALPYRQEVEDAADKFSLVGSRRKVDHGGGSTPDGAQRVLQRAGVGHALHLLGRAGLHVGGRVNVRLDPAGSNDSAGGVYLLHRFIGERARRADGDDATVLHSDVHDGGLGGHYNGAASDQQIEHGWPPAASGTTMTERCAGVAAITVATSGLQPFQGQVPARPQFPCPLRPAPHCPSACTRRHAGSTGQDWWDRAG